MARLYVSDAVSRDCSLSEVPFFLPLGLAKADPTVGCFYSQRFSYLLLWSLVADFEFLAVLLPSVLLPPPGLRSLLAFPVPREKIPTLAPPVSFFCHPTHPGGILTQTHSRPLSSFAQKTQYRNTVDAGIFPPSLSNGSTHVHNHPPKISSPTPHMHLKDLPISLPPPLEKFMAS